MKKTITKRELWNLRTEKDTKGLKRGSSFNSNIKIQIP